jgi:DNA-binding transcriptional MerR regulator
VVVVNSGRIQEMQVHEVAMDLGITPDTVRYYTRAGLLEPARNLEDSYKDYGKRNRHRLRFILSARHLGFSVSDIGQNLEQADKGESPCQLIRQLSEGSLEEVNKRWLKWIR